MVIPITSLIFWAAIAALCWAASSALTAWSIGLAQKKQLLAEVNERSSHRVPTPRVGGIGLFGAMLIGFAIVALGLALKQGTLSSIITPLQGSPRSLTWLQLGGFVFATALAFVLGLWDDRANPPAAIKLAGQLAIAVIPPLMGLRLQELSLPWVATPIVLPTAVGFIVTAVWVLVVMNAVNFMDGINGLAGRLAQGVACSLGACVIGYMGGEVVLVLSAALFGGAAGFIKHNIPTARTFMGDCGSQPLGVFTALLAIHAASSPMNYPTPFIATSIVFSVFLFDVGLTVIRRTLAGKNIMHAHREHLYQRYLINHGEDHVATLSFAEWHLLIAGLIGAIYGRFFFGNNIAVAPPSRGFYVDHQGDIIKTFLLVAMVVNLVLYWRAAEKGSTA